MSAFGRLHEEACLKPLLFIWNSCVPLFIIKVISWFYPTKQFLMKGGPKEALVVLKRTKGIHKQATAPLGNAVLQ